MSRFVVWSIADREGLTYGEPRWYVSVENGKFGFSRKISHDHALALIKKMTNCEYDWWENRNEVCRVCHWQLLKVIK